MILDSNVIHYVDNLIYRSGRPTFLDIALIKAETVICLETEREHIREEWDICRSNHIRHINYPLHWLLRPKVKDLDEIVSVMVEQEKPLLVHCRRGIDRTGFAIAAYRRLVQGWTFARAWQECLDMGHRHWLLWWWRKSLEEL